jgi:DNA-binding LacI/PurR family transcriptional regulator
MEDLGLSAPGDFGIMGFDNIDLLNSIRPRLATVDYHIHEIGDMTVRCLLELIHNTQPRLKENKYIVHHTIVDGQTL